MKDLIEKLEKASGPDRALDALIECELRKLQAYEVGLTDAQRSHWKPIGSMGEVIDHQGCCRYHPPTYTFSMDAAVCLAPTECDWSIHWDGGEAIAGCMPSSEDGCDVADCRAATPAIALCIAALKARQATATER